MKKLALLTASLAILATPVFAQSPTAPETSRSDTVRPADTVRPVDPAKPGVTTGMTKPEAKNASAAKDQMFSSKLKGLNVYNQANESVGEISDLVLRNNQIDALVLSVGGFLGVGQHYVAVAPSSVNITYDRSNDKWNATMNTTKETLKAAPQFVYP